MSNCPPRLKALTSPILFAGGDSCAYRDPTVWYENGVFYLYFTYVDSSQTEGPYLFTAMSTSTDLKDWSPITLLTPRDRSKNFSSPGNILPFEGRYYLCLQTYCRENGEKYGNGNSRLWTMASDDLLHWEEPKLLKVKGEIPVQEMGRMIDPYLLADRQSPGQIWCFYKQNGASFSISRDLRCWTPMGRVDCGENVCVLPKKGEDGYYIFHSPKNGIGILETSDFRQFTEFSPPLRLGQDRWNWAKGRITAGFVLDLTAVEGFGVYLMFFHGSGPEDEETMFDSHASLGIAWSEDLLHWSWPRQGDEM